ncbi:MAG TPA: S53 family peptidase [Chloroflexota bacterium]|nr:S53 family peptidase [Chloroflexota bacterium]
MTYRPRLGSVFLAGLAVLIGSALPGTTLAQSGGARYAGSALPAGRIIPLAGSTLPHLAAARRLQDLNPAAVLGVTVSLRLRDDAGLQRFLRSVYDPRSPQYHHFLTPAQFAERFAPLPADRARVAAWLRSRGLGVEREYADGLGITVRGTARRLESAFGTQLSTYRKGADVFYANGGPVRLPSEIAAQVEAVSGLDNADRPRPLGVRSRQIVPHSDAPHAPTHDSSQGYTPSDLAGLYDVQPIYDKGWNGSNQVIALAEFGDFQSGNIATYDSQFQLSPQTQRVPVNDGSQIGEKINDNQPEVELDIEVAHAMAPGARVDVYIAPYHSADWIPMLLLMASNNPQIVSSSYGQAESFRDPNLVWAMDALFREMAAQGITVFSAAGDQGAYDASAVSGATQQQKQQLVVDHPASDPWVTAVGGTALLQNSDGSYGGESAWGNPQDSQGPSGGGGGLSGFFPRPDYQVGPGVQNQYSDGSRQVPDVSANADPRTGYAVYTVDSNKQAGWLVYGGTSAATPLWAAYTSLIDQYINSRVGFFNPTLYALGQKESQFQYPPFHDVTQGNNLYYSATPGWDYATGWGSFDGAALLVDLQQMGLVHYSIPPVDIRMVAGLAKVSKNKVTPLKTVKRGSTIYFYVDMVTEAVPDNSPVLWKFTLVPASRSGGYQWIKHTTLSSRDVGREKVLVWKIKISSKARRGAYTFTAGLAVDNTSVQASSRVTVK